MNGMDNAGTQVAAIDVGAAMLWLGTNFILATFSCRTSYIVFPTDGFAVRLSASVLLFISTILMAVIGLGSVGLLHGWMLLTLVAAVSIVGLYSTRGDAGTKRATGGPDTEAVTSLFQPENPNSVQFWFWLWTSAGALGLGYAIRTGLLRFPSDFDSLMYHLPIVDQWLQAGSLYAPNSSYWWTPGTSEVVGLWMVAPFSGDFLIALNNLPFALLWGTAGLAVAYELELPRPFAHLTALASLITYTTLEELNDARNDLAIVALCMAGACFGLRFLKWCHTRDLVFFSMAVGALCGVKYNALGYSTLLIVAVVALTSVRCGFAAAGRPAAFSVLGVLLLSGYWYGRNWIAGTSPIYPMGIGRDIATGYPDVWSTTFLGNGDPRLLRIGFEALWKMTGPIQLIAVGSTPLLTAYFAFRSFAPRWRDAPSMPKEGRLVSSFLLLLLPGSAFLLFITPFCLEDRPGTLNQLEWGYAPTRYGLCFLSVAVLALVRFGIDMWDSKAIHWVRMRARLGQLRGSLLVSSLFECRRDEVLPVAILMGIVLWQFVLRLRHAENPFDHFDTGVIAFSLFVIALLVGSATSQIPRWARRTMGVVILGALAASVGLLSHRWHDGYGTYYDTRFETAIFRRTETSSPVRTDRVCVLELQVYPFFGSRRQTRVLRPRVVSSSDSLAGYLLDHDVQVVVTKASNYPQEFLYANTLELLRNDAQRYSLITNQGHYSVFVVRSLATGELPR